jgi:hypothetical protein
MPQQDRVVRIREFFLLLFSDRFKSIALLPHPFERVPKRLRKSACCQEARCSIFDDLWI